MDEQGFLIFTALNYRSAAKNMEGVAMLHQIIDSFGEKSAKAQNLSVPITSVKKINGTNQRLIFKIDNSKILGFIKSGEKNLFHRNKVIVLLSRGGKSANFSLFVCSIFMSMSQCREAESAKYIP